MDNWFYRHKAEALENAEGLKSYANIFIINVSTALWMTKDCQYVCQYYQRGEDTKQSKQPQIKKTDLYAQSEGTEKVYLNFFSK